MRLSAISYRLSVQLSVIAALLAAVAGCAPSAPATMPAPAGATTAPTRLAAASDQYLTADGVRLRYREIGRGEPVVLLHGYTQRLEGMGELADSLARDYRVIVLDERGFGESSKFAEPERFGRAMADDVVRLLDHLGIRRAHLVGHSMGAAIAANIAARYPDRIATATLVAGPFFPDSAAFAKRSAPWLTALERGEGLRDFFVWLFPGMTDSVAVGVSAQLLAQNDMGSLLAVMRSMGALVVSRDRGREIRTPALIAVGTGDPLLPQSREIAAWWPSAQLLVIPGADHANVIVRPEVLGSIRETIRRSP